MNCVLVCFDLFCLLNMYHCVTLYMWAHTLQAGHLRSKYDIDKNMFFRLLCVVSLFKLIIESFIIIYLYLIRIPFFIKQSDCLDIFKLHNLRWFPVFALVVYENKNNCSLYCYFSYISYVTYFIYCTYGTQSGNVEISTFSILI